MLSLSRTLFSVFFAQAYTAASDQSAQIHTQMKINVSMRRKPELYPLKTINSFDKCMTILQ